MTFATLIAANLALILTNRSWSRLIYQTLSEMNIAFWSVYFGASVFLGLVIYNPFLRSLFKFEVLRLTDLLVAVCLGFLTVLPFEVVKMISRRGKLDLLEELKPSGGGILE
jgi:Ca2+-transporting ATPase